MAKNNEIRLMLKNYALIQLILSSVLFINIVGAECNDSITKNTPDSRFKVNGDGTVTDLQTLLIWQRCHHGQDWDGVTCTGSIVQDNWPTILEASQNSDFANNDNWRLPNIVELTSIVEFACFNPSINESMFPNTLEFSQWTSSPNIDGADSALGINFEDGDQIFIFKSNIAPARFVRNSD